MGFQQMLLAWKSTWVHDSQPIGDVVPKDLHPSLLSLYHRNPDGTPVDARDLFIQSIFRELIETVFRRYYTGFVGHSPDHAAMASLDLDRLTERLVDELGMDRYMEEVFRAVDQRQMSDEELTEFLVGRGLSEEEASSLQRGVEDITLLTGPHLGRFNDRISVPELIQCVSAVSALCVADRFMMERCILDSHKTKPFPERAQ